MPAGPKTLGHGMWIADTTIKTEETFWSQML